MITPVHPKARNQRLSVLTNNPAHETITRHARNRYQSIRLSDSGLKTVSVGAFARIGPEESLHLTVKSWAEDSGLAAADRV
jgi:hypothetical protein